MPQFVPWKSNWKDYETILNRYHIGNLYHFTSKQNIASIKKNGGLFSWAECREKGIHINCPGGDSLSHKLDKAAGLDGYVRLSFTRNHPMMFYKGIEDAVVLRIDRTVVYWKGNKYSDMNATRSGANIGCRLDDFRAIHFSTVQSINQFVLPEDERMYYQAEVLVKNSIPLEFITFP